ncbi:MAG: hypothetical protein GY861_00100 [bacterium]|nr:hypothetical protein [bacterium]
MIVDKINKYIMKEKITINEMILDSMADLAKFNFKRQFNSKPDKGGTLRLSSSGKCPRSQAYSLYEYPIEGKGIDHRAKMIFWLGDMVEMTIVTLAQAAGVKLEGVGLDQQTVTLKIEDAEIKGHPDGIVDGKYLLEVKSMSSYAYQKFEKGIIDDTYLAQVNIYMECLGLDECIFVAMAKDSGTLGELRLKKDNDIVAKVKENLTTILKSKHDELLPDGQFEPDAKGIYPWNCLYCNYWGHCKPNAKKVLMGRSYKLKECV